MLMFYYEDDKGAVVNILALTVDQMTTQKVSPMVTNPQNYHPTLRQAAVFVLKPACALPVRLLTADRHHSEAFSSL